MDSNLSVLSEGSLASVLIAVDFVIGSVVMGE
jgi:hypothetical protein